MRWLKFLCILAISPCFQFYWYISRSCSSTLYSKFSQCRSYPPMKVPYLFYFAVIQLLMTWDLHFLAPISEPNPLILYSTQDINTLCFSSICSVPHFYCLFVIFYWTHSLQQIIQKLSFLEISVLDFWCEGKEKSIFDGFDFCLVELQFLDYPQSTI